MTNAKPIKVGLTAVELDSLIAIGKRGLENIEQNGDAFRDFLGSGGSIKLTRSVLQKLQRIRYSD